MSKDILALAQKMTGFAGSENPVGALSLQGKRGVETPNPGTAARFGNVPDSKNPGFCLCDGVKGRFFKVAARWAHDATHFGNVAKDFGNVVDRFANVAGNFVNVLNDFGNVFDHSTFAKPSCSTT